MTYRGRPSRRPFFFAQAGSRPLPSAAAFPPEHADGKLSAETAASALGYGMTDGPVQEFQIGRSKTRHGFVIAAIGVVVGLATLLFADETVKDSQLIGVLLVIMGIGVGFYAWRTVNVSGAQLRIDETGVFFREWGTTIPWSQIDDVYQSGSRVQPFITLSVRDPKQLLSVLAEPEARALSRNRLWKSPELRIPYSAVEASRDEILTAIESGLKTYGPS